MVAQRSPLVQRVTGLAIIAGGIAIGVTVLRHTSMLGLLIVFGFAVCGVFQIVVARQVTIVADKPTGMLSVAWRTLLGAGNNSATLADIDAVTYRETVSTQGRSGSRRKVRRDSVVVYLKNHSIVPLDKEQTATRTYTFFAPSLAQASDEVVGRALAEFVGVPFYDDGVAVLPTATDQFGQSPSVDSQEPERVSASASAAAPALAAPAAAPATAAAPAHVAAPAPATAAPGAPGGAPYWEQAPPPWSTSSSTAPPPASRL
jgi:hypothetical protein